MDGQILEGIACDETEVFEEENMENILWLGDEKYIPGNDGRWIKKEERSKDEEIDDIEEKWLRYRNSLSQP